MSESSTRDAGLTARVISFMQARPGQLVRVEELVESCGRDGQPAKRGSVQTIMSNYSVRAPHDLEVVSGGTAWIWRGAAADSAPAQVLKIHGRTKAGVLICEAPDGSLYAAKEIA